MTTPTDLRGHFAVAGYNGIAFFVRGYAQTMDEFDKVDDPQFVVAVMVGDDREHIVDIDDLTPIDEENFCAECGQIGCFHDGREHEEDS